MRATAIFGWFLSFALVLGIAGPLFGTCTQGDDSPWRAGLLVFAPVGLVGLALVATGTAFGVRYLWFAFPHVLTVALGLYLVPVYFSGTTLGGQHVCSVREGSRFGEAPSLLQQAWAPAWLSILLVLGYVRHGPSLFKKESC